MTVRTVFRRVAGLLHDVVDGHASEHTRAWGGGWLLRARGRGRQWEGGRNQPLQASVPVGSVILLCGNIYCEGEGVVRRCVARVAHVYNTD